VSQTTGCHRLDARRSRQFATRRTSFAQLLDTSGSALAQVGSVALPRLYVLDPAGQIVWFDIEYSESTRRELSQTLGVLTGNAK